MSDFDENGRRIPDYDEREEAAMEKKGNRIVRCPQCNEPCGKWYPAEPQLWNIRSPAELDEYTGSVRHNDDLFCRAECLRIYMEE